MINRKMSLLSALCLFFFSSLVFANEKSEESICDGRDNRRISNKAPVGRLRGCTLTMIGSSCAVSAGHCSSTFTHVRFNTRDNSQILEDSYQVDRQSVVAQDNGKGDDWAVLRLKRNAYTGQWPGDVQGTFPIARRRASVGDIIEITGYGTSASFSRSLHQQTHEGEITRFTRGGIRRLLGFFSGKKYAVLEHRADTTGGNSGSAVINQRTGEIIGVHTHGGCRDNGRGANASTEILRNDEFKQAINRCLKWERQNL